MPRRLLVLQHDSIAHLAEAAGPLSRLEMDQLDVSRGDVLPASLTGYDGLLVLGGPQTAYDDTGFPTRTHEIALLREALEAQLPALGICLGAQLLALAGGGSCSRLPAPERGWTPVTLTAAAASDVVFAAYEGAAQVEVMSSHIDAITLPQAATLLVESERCVQGFRIGTRAWGAQYHPEAGRGFASTRRALLPELWSSAAEERDDPALEERRQLAAQRAGAGLFTRFAELVAAPALPQPRTEAGVEITATAAAGASS